VKCKSCGFEHSPLLTCSRAARIAAFHEEQAKRQVPAILVRQKPPAVSLTIVKPKFDRAAYQREYMRKKREAAKAKKT